MQDVSIIHHSKTTTKMMSTDLASSSGLTGLSFSTLSFLVVQGIQEYFGWVLYRDDIVSI